MDAQDLKNSILQLAIQGKLVEQRKEEGTAKELIDQIKAEKEQLIKEGKIKKEKPLPEITEDEIPFDIPESWERVRLGEVISLTSGQDMKPNKYNDTKMGIPYLTGASNIDDGNLIINRWTNEPKAIAIKGDLLLTCKGTVGTTTILQEEKVHIARQIMSIRTFIMDIEYIHLFTKSYVNTLKANAKSMIPGIERKNVLEAVIPLPPLKEQKRIVAKIEELIPYIEKYGEAHSKLEAFNKKFPEDMQKSILQYAIQGKLVEQKEEEGTAEELYQQIQEEKAELIKKGRIKKEIPLPTKAEDEMPFEIPASWKWVRLSDVIDVRDGTHDTPTYLASGYPLITGKDFYNGYFDLSKTQYISKEDYYNIRRRSNVEVGDILFSMIGGNIGSMILINDKNYFEMAIKNVALFKQYAYNIGLSKYLMYYLKSQVPKIKATANGGAQSFVPLKVLRNYLFPLPPLEEQKRIVAKIEELMPYCQQLVK